MSEVKYGILLEHPDAVNLLDCVEYRLRQLGQELKATGKDIGSYRPYIHSLQATRAQVLSSLNSMAGHENPESVIINGELEK